jgi:hypothetical protein
MVRGFWAVPKSIAKRNDLSCKTKLVAGILWTRRNADFLAFPSRKYMAEALSVSVKTVERALKELKEKAGLKVERKGLGKNNRYLFPDWDTPELSLSDKTPLSLQEKTPLSPHIVRDNSKENTSVDEDSSVREIISFFKSKVKEIKGYDPEINWAKEGRLVKQRLKKYNSKQIKELIDWYLHSRHTERLGDSLSICLSTNTINLWKASRVSSEFFFSKFYPPLHS